MNSSLSRIKAHFKTKNISKIFSSIVKLNSNHMSSLVTISYLESREKIIPYRKQF